MRCQVDDAQFVRQVGGEVDDRIFDSGSLKSAGLHYQSARCMSSYSLS
ncbi:hypothetical protein SLEP1_g59463 [Rubroshorea leprosula]|uniref:Uncharacterized protein n=1 Tax=Rubroshorea leprosula TaxID=152421 RepID=A0AAV5MSF2_9ROSI|nr:hypothetical protein SLEP1_g59463 [Rubroshorea leprosula]